MFHSPTAQKLERDDVACLRSAMGYHSTQANLLRLHTSASSGKNTCRFICHDEIWSIAAGEDSGNILSCDAPHQTIASPSGCEEQCNSIHRVKISIEKTWLEREHSPLVSSVNINCIHMCKISIILWTIGRCDTK